MTYKCLEMWYCLGTRYQYFFNNVLRTCLPLQ